MAITGEGHVNWREAGVLVTGGTGSFGHKFVELMLTRYRPRRLCVFSRDELKQSEMMARFDDPSLRFFLGDVRDRERLARAMHGLVLQHGFRRAELDRLVGPWREVLIGPRTPVGPMPRAERRA